MAAVVVDNRIVVVIVANGGGHFIYGTPCSQTSKYIPIILLKSWATEKNGLDIMKYIKSALFYIKSFGSAKNFAKKMQTSQNNIQLSDD